MSAAFYRAIMAEAPDILALRHVSLPVDVTDAEQFPEIERARQHAASLSPERRTELGL